MNIYVGNLPKTTTEEAVRNIFAEHCEVTEVKLIKDQYSGELRGFGFVEMADDDAATAAISALDQSEQGGRRLRVNEAIEKPRRNNRQY